MKCKIYFCLGCNKASLVKEEIADHGCDQKYALQGTIAVVKQIPWRRFIDFLIRCDFYYGLAFTGGVIINALLLPHFNLSFKLQLLESLCVGFVLIRLLREQE
jgi:hypothetical protein